MSPFKTVAALLCCVAAIACLPRCVPAQDDPPAEDPPSKVQRDQPPGRDADPRSGGPPRFDPKRDNRAGDSPPQLRGRRPAGAPTFSGNRSGPPIGMPNGPQYPGMPMGQPTPGMPMGGGLPGPPDHLKRYDPEMYKLDVADKKLERETLELSQMYRLADAGQKDEIRRMLQEKVEQHFDVRQSRREIHLKRLQEELQQLQKAIEGRVKQRPEIISRRVSELLGESDLEF